MIEHLSGIADQQVIARLPEEPVVAPAGIVEHPPDDRVADAPGIAVEPVASWTTPELVVAALSVIAHLARIADQPAGQLEDREARGRREIQEGLIIPGAADEVVIAALDLVVQNGAVAEQQIPLGSTGELVVAAAPLDLVVLGGAGEGIASIIADDPGHAASSRHIRCSALS
jgi:hypothetical protein